MDPEVELGVVIGDDGSVFGYTIVNDVSSRDPWLDGDQWVLGKSMPGFCPVGPVIVTADEFDPTDVRLGCTINGVAIQDGRTSDMRFSIAEVIDHLGRHVRLEWRPDRVGDASPAGRSARSGSPPGTGRRGDLLDRGHRRTDHDRRLSATRGGRHEAADGVPREMTNREVEAFVADHARPRADRFDRAARSARPLSTDTIVPTEVARRVAPKVGAAVAPSIGYGLSYPHAGFTGVVYLRIPTFMALVEDVAVGLATMGFRTIVFLNGHYDNTLAIAYACANAAIDCRRRRARSPSTTGTP